MCIDTVSKCIIHVVGFPQVVTHPTDTSAVAPFSAVFSCSVQAYGYLTVTWYKNNGTHVPGKAYSRLISSTKATTSILIIPNVTINDVGTYYCVVQANRKTAQSLGANLILSGRSCSYFFYLKCDMCAMLHIFRPIFTTNSNDRCCS